MFLKENNTFSKGGPKMDSKTFIITQKISISISISFYSSNNPEETCHVTLKTGVVTMLKIPLTSNNTLHFTIHSNKNYNFNILQYCFCICFY